MARELIIYCDESDISGKHFSNFYGGALVESIHQAEVIDRLTAKKAELNLGAEVKWQKISANYADKYISFLDEVFALLAEDKTEDAHHVHAKLFRCSAFDGRATRE
jgi:hypothetical protein